MRSNKAVLMNISLVLVLALGLSGCTIILQKGRRTDIEKISKRMERTTWMMKVTMIFYFLGVGFLMYDMEQTADCRHAARLKKQDFHKHA